MIAFPFDSLKEQLAGLARKYWQHQSNHLRSKLAVNTAEQEMDAFVKRYAPHLLEARDNARREYSQSKEAAELARREMVQVADEAVQSHSQRNEYSQFLPQGLDVRAKTEVVLPDSRATRVAQVVEWMYGHDLGERVTIKFTGLLDFIRTLSKVGKLPTDVDGSPLIALETNPEITVKAFERWEEYQVSDLNDGFDERGRLPDETTATPENLMFRHPDTRAFLFKDGDVVSILPLVMEADDLAVTEGKVAFTANQFLFVSKNGDRNQMAIDELYEALVDDMVKVTRHAPA